MITNTNYSHQEILEQLDDGAMEDTFPILDHPYIRPFNSKLTAYRDNQRWVIIIEVVGMRVQSGKHDSIHNYVHVLGNCLPNDPDVYVIEHFTEDSEEGPTFTIEEELSPNVSTMLLRGKKIPINHNLDYYDAIGIKLSNPPKIKLWECMRGLVPEYGDLFFAPEVEIRELIPNDLPLFVTVKEWNHPDIYSEEIPSENETFILLAKSLEQGDKQLFQPTKKPNNHWSNWPEGGTL